MTNFQEQLEEIKQACNALSLNETSVLLAEEFIKKVMEIYPELPYPELCPNIRHYFPKGCLGFYWDTKRGLLTISIDENHKLSYIYMGTGLVGSDSFEYTGTVPTVFNGFTLKYLLGLETPND